MRDDLIFALYLFCQQYHNGQSSRGYRILSRIQTRYPGIRIARGHEVDIQLDCPIYRSLVQNYAECM